MGPAGRQADRVFGRIWANEGLSVGKMSDHLRVLKNGPTPPQVVRRKFIMAVQFETVPSSALPVSEFHGRL